MHGRRGDGKFYALKKNRHTALALGNKSVSSGGTATLRCVMIAIVVAIEAAARTTTAHSQEWLCHINPTAMP